MKLPFKIISLKDFTSLSNQLEQLRKINQEKETEIKNLLQMYDKESEENSHYKRVNELNKQAMVFIGRYDLADLKTDFLVYRGRGGLLIYVKRFPYNHNDPESRNFAREQAQYLCDILNEDLSSVTVPHGSLE